MDLEAEFEAELAAALTADDPDDIHAVPDPPGLFAAVEARNFDSFKKLMAAINATAKDAGFAILKRRSSNWNEDIKQYARFDLVCDRAPSHNYVPRGQKQHNRPSRRDACDWAAKAVLSRANKAWNFTVRQAVHNHAMSHLAANIPAHRRHDRNTPEIREKIFELDRCPRNTAADIASMIRHDFPGVVITKQDVIDTLAQDAEKGSGRFSTFRRFLNALENDEKVVQFVFRDANDMVCRIFWTTEKNLAMWRENSEVLSWDATYCINEFDMPLTQINGVNEVHDTFTVGLALTLKETEDDEKWIFECINQLICNRSISLPYVMISDYHRATKNACSTVLSATVKQQICLWHVMKNVAFNVRKLWKGQLNGTVLGESGFGKGKRIGDDEEDPIPIDPELKDDDEAQEKSEESVNDDKLADQLDQVALRLLSPADRKLRMANNGAQQVTAKLVPGRCKPGGRRIYFENADGILVAWSDVVYAETQEKHVEVWLILVKEFNSQQGELFLFFSRPFSVPLASIL